MTGGVTNHHHNCAPSPLGDELVEQTADEILAAIADEIDAEADWQMLRPSTSAEYVAGWRDTASWVRSVRGR